ncbi:MAG: peptide ABC transporter substrate-binding protein [Deltaproteobacteria bacterium]|nr:peptide ABC transporter substrate-binding protein [Deltaproteobacteria bacterium]
MTPVARRWTSALGTLAIGALASFSATCTNNPYPAADQGRKVLYTAFEEAPKTLDPQVSYTTVEHAFTGNIFDTPLEYHFLKRPYTLIPGMAKSIPVAEHLPDGKIRYRIEFLPELIYADDPCFELGGAGRKTRPMVAKDLEFAYMRVADPKVVSPFVDPMSNVLGFKEFIERLEARRKSDPSFVTKPAHEQYAAVGPIEGIVVVDDATLDLVLDHPYPQILYWLAFPFSTPVPWEAVAYYNGKDGHPLIQDHPVSTGPYTITHYDKQARIVLEVNKNWYGYRHPEWKLPATVYPSEGEPGDAEMGRLDAAYVGKPLPFVERLEYRREKEDIPRFNKFLQGYYDASGIVKESFDKVIANGQLTPEMAELGIRLEKTIEPAFYYLGFNMMDKTVGHGGGEKARLLRQAMSLCVDTKEWLRLFLNGRGVPAEYMIPSSIFGYEASYQNPYRKVDLDKARAVLVEAGYPGGIDPATGKPLRLTFDTGDTTVDGILRNQFFVDEWRQIGLDIRIDATNYNQFQEKLKKGAHQVYFWGWSADYPDPENFLFLLDTAQGRVKFGGPNDMNYSNPEYDRLFELMKARDNDDERMRLIRELRAITEHDAPMIDLMFNEAYSLRHQWVKNVKPFGMSTPMTKYRDVEPEIRDATRLAWNHPVMWPAYTLAILGIAVTVPGIVTFLRERQ